MQFILVVSILANVLLIWHAIGTADKKYTYEDIEGNLKRRDDEYLQLTYKYFQELYGDDSMKIAKEQSKFYEIGRRLKIIKS